MPEYIQYDASGRIVKKWYSADSSVVSGLPNILEISRSTFYALTKFYVVDSGALREMTQAEKDALTAEEAQALIDAENQRIVDLDDKIASNLGDMILTKADNAIDNIGSLNDAKLFLKKLCRYIIKYISR